MLLSIGDQVKPGSYRLHSVFPRAVNFERRGRLVSVVDEAIGPGPLNIVLRNLGRASVPASPDLHESRQSVGSRGRSPSQVLGPWSTVHGLRSPSLRVTARTVRVADRRYRYTRAQRYCSSLELRAVDRRRFQQNLSLLGNALRDAAPPKSLAFLLDRKRRRNFRAGFERAYAERIERGVRQVFHGHLPRGIRDLKGCGLGLTPGGDDFIAGLLIGLHVLQKLRGQTQRPTINAVYRAARGNNIYSNTFLDLARHGLLFGRMRDLLRAIVSGTTGSVRAAARALFAVGETSGADLATGFFLTLRGRQSVVCLANGPLGGLPRDQGAVKMTWKLSR